MHRSRDVAGGRFIQPDPLGLAGGDLSLYVLRKNNPLSYTDPKGESAVAVGTIVAGIVIVGGAMMSAVPKPKQSDSAFPGAANDSKFGDRTCPPDCAEQKRLLDQAYIALKQMEKAASVLDKVVNPLQWTFFWGKVKIYELQCGPYNPPFVDDMNKIQDFYGR